VNEDFTTPTFWLCSINGELQQKCPKLSATFTPNGIAFTLNLRNWQEKFRFAEPLVNKYQDDNDQVLMADNEITLYLQNPFEKDTEKRFK